MNVPLFSWISDVPGHANKIKEHFLDSVRVRLPGKAYSMKNKTVGYSHGSRQTNCLARLKDLKVSPIRSVVIIPINT